MFLHHSIHSNLTSTIYYYVKGVKFLQPPEEQSNTSKKKLRVVSTQTPTYKTVNRGDVGIAEGGVRRINRQHYDTCSSS